MRVINMGVDQHGNTPLATYPLSHDAIERAYMDMLDDVLEPAAARKINDETLTANGAWLHRCVGCSDAVSILYTYMIVAQLYRTAGSIVRMYSESAQRCKSACGVLLKTGSCM